MSQLKKRIQENETDVLERETAFMTQKLKEEEEKISLSRFAQTEKYIQQGKAYEQEEMYAEALAEYDRASSIAPSDPRILECRKFVLLKLKEIEVRELVNTALEKLKSGDLHSARKDFSQILTIIPDE
ncbi:MAG: hypothetical protein NT079_04780 [Candidatus Omnitrophica bacterium]|nr:hypothetical protein [Candidatus Omnitrophota bacterium]